MIQSWESLRVLCIKMALLFYSLLLVPRQAQVGLLIILLAAMADFVIGSFIGPMSDEEYSRGFVGYNGKWNVTLAWYKS